MQTSTSKLTKKYQATIPEPVRRVLHLEAGEWSSEADEEAYRDL